MDNRTHVLDRNMWADELLRRLSKDEQIEWLIKKLANPLRDGEDELDLLRGLETIFEEDKVAFRKQLRCIYEQLIEGHPKLAAAIAKKIIQGWDWKWKAREDYHMPAYHRRGKNHEVNPDAKECFQFFCQTAYERANEQLQKLLMEVLHEHVNAHRFREGEKYLDEWMWRAEDLNEWILEKEVSDIRMVLTAARVRIGGNTLALREVFFSQSFQTQVRSPEAIALIATQMKIVRRTEELVQTFVEWVRPTNQYGDLNPNTVFTSRATGVKWKLESASVARVEITFHRAADPKIITKSIMDVQVARDQFLSKIESPPRILIEAEVPDGFHYKE